MASRKPRSAPTNEQILAEIHSISTVADFVAFMQSSKLLPPGYYGPENIVFPNTTGTTVIDALLAKISDIGPLPLDTEHVNNEHPWFICLRRCAEASGVFHDDQSPHHAGLHHRFVDVLTNCFVAEKDDWEGKCRCYDYVTCTLAKVIHKKYHNSTPSESFVLVRYPSGFSEALIVYLLNGIRDFSRWFGEDTHSGCQLAYYCILRSSSLKKWIRHLVENRPNCTVLRKFCPKNLARIFNDVELLRSLFRSVFVTRQSHCCTEVSRLIGKILKQSGSSFPPAFFNSPLNLPDESGANIEDTPLSIACRGTHYCIDSENPPEEFCRRLLELGADINGFVQNPGDANNKMVSRRDGKTPFMIACDFASDNVVKLFLTQPALDLTLRDVDGLSAINHLLRRRDCEHELLWHLRTRDPALFESHVTIDDLDYAVRHGIHDSVDFILSLNNVHLGENSTSRLQELLKFCVEGFLSSSPFGKLERDPWPYYCRSRTVQTLENRDNCKQCGHSPREETRDWQSHRENDGLRLHCCAKSIAARLRRDGDEVGSFTFVGRRERSALTDET